jgi:uncharacterized protein
MTRRLILTIIGIIAAVTLSFLWFRSAHAPVASGLPQVTFMAPDGSETQLSIETADDPVERAKGLMGRESLPAGQGMLFMFDEPQDLSFWMKNTLIPLDILYFDGDGMFVSRTTMQPCDVPVCPVYPSMSPARYAVEVNVGETLTKEVNVGWNIRLP